MVKVEKKKPSKGGSISDSSLSSSGESPDSDDEAEKDDDEEVSFKLQVSSAGVTWTNSMGPWNLICLADLSTA